MVRMDSLRMRNRRLEIAELTEYAKDRYNMNEEHKWEKFPAFSVLTHPETGKWIALLMNHKMEDGNVSAVCDLKCGQENIAKIHKPYLGVPFRMRGADWAGIRFGPDTERDIILRLFDSAIKQEEPGGCRIVLENPAKDKEERWHDTAVPVPIQRRHTGRRGKEPEDLPAEIAELRRMIRKSRDRYPDIAGISTAARAADFYAQAKRMENYEDDTPWKGGFFQFLPTYGDLSPRQLRGYFGWRTQVRQGKYTQIPLSAAYIYIYELLNGIGVQTAEESLEKIEEFETNYFHNAEGSAGHLQTLRRWKYDFCILRGLPAETARKYAEPGRVKRDEALAVLRRPDEYDDKQVFEALMTFSEKGRRESPVITSDMPRAQRLFADAWRRAQTYEFQGMDLFTMCFGKMRRKPWFPMWRALYSEQKPNENRSYRLGKTRSYELNSRMWYTTAYDRSAFNLGMLRGFLHAADLQLRKYLKMGRPLRARENEAWAGPYIEAAIEADRKERAKEMQPEITINMEHLSKIRRDAAVTRDSLLTDEELGVTETAANAPDLNALTAPGGSQAADLAAEEEASPLTEAQTAIVQALIQGKPTDSILRQEHMMPSVAADEINEALFDLIGDNLITSDDDILQLVEDYREEATELLGGSSYGRE